MSTSDHIVSRTLFMLLQLQLLLLLTSWVIQSTEARRNQVIEGASLTAVRLGPRREEEKRREFLQDLQRAVSYSDEEEEEEKREVAGTAPKTRRKNTSNAIKKVILRHSCVKMDSDDIISILRQGRAPDSPVLRELKLLRKTLSKRAMLCRLKRVRWTPLRVSRAGTKALSCQSSGTMGGGRVPDRALLDRLRGQIRASGCWTTETRALYKLVARRGANKAGRRGKTSEKAWCVLMKRYDQCVSKNKDEKH